METKVIEVLKWRMKKILFKRRSRKNIETYLRRNESPHLLHLGCGELCLPGWLNTDINLCFWSNKKIVYLDATRKYPLPDKSFDYVFSEHMFEHLLLQDAVNMLYECKRILKDGGVIRICLPDMSFLMDLYLHPENYKEYLKWSTEHFLPEIKELFPGIYPEVFVINNFYRDWGHKVIYDYKTLELLLKKCGYKNVKQCEVGESTHSVLRNIEGHDKNTLSGLTKIESMVIEASV